MAHIDLITVHVKYRKKQNLLNDNYLNNINRNYNMQFKRGN